MEGIIPSIAAAVATEQPGEREAGIHAPHSGDGGGTVVDDRQLAAIRRAASKIAEQLARGLARTPIHAIAEIVGLDDLDT